MNITVIQSRDIIRGVRDRWKRQYKHYADDYRVGWGESLTAGEIRSRLDALDLETCSKADVDVALQTAHWASNDCDLCEKDVETTIRIGDEPDYVARWVDLCPECLAKAAKTLG